MHPTVARGSRLLALSLVVACGDDGGRPPGAESVGPTGTTAALSTASGDDAPASGSSPSTTSDDDPGSSGLGDDGTSTGGPEPTGSDTAPPPSLCDDVEGEPFVPPSVCDGPSGYTSTEIPPNGLYSTSWFGCYLQDDGSIYQDPSDNCQFACGNMGLCPAGQDGPTCEANLRWFAADADRYGCGGRIRVTNCDNGNAVVLATLDRGPNCGSVEMPCGAPVLDMSHDAMVHLFEGGTYGGCELQGVVVEPVDPSTPLGPA